MFKSSTLYPSQVQDAIIGKNIKITGQLIARYGGSAW